MKETEEQLEKQAEEYRLQQASDLLRTLGYLPDQHGRYWKEEDLVAQKKKFYRIARPCPIDSKGHDFKAAYLFLGEAQRFEIGAALGDLVCKKCLGQLSDYLMFWVVEK
jgi:hypothetical protein